MAATLATNVKGTVITSSPGPMPAAIRVRWSALVPELSAMHSDAPQYEPKSCSNAATSGPRTNWQLSSTRAMAASISGLMLWYCAFKSRYGTLTFAMSADFIVSLARLRCGLKRGKAQVDGASTLRHRLRGSLQDFNDAEAGSAS